MRQDMFLRKIEYDCSRNGLFAPGDRILAGVSGGADSMCLLVVLEELAKEHGWELLVVHVNHGLREEAGRDEAYVEAYCRNHHIPFFAQKADVIREAAERHETPEEAGRNARYRIFSRIADRIGADKIALAHHRDDQAETVLWNLFRGTGLDGLAGMAYRRDRIVRPLLGVSRQEIEAFLTERGIPWMTDHTNGENHYTRNRIRNLLLPEIREKLNPRAEEHIADAAEDLRQIGDYLNEAAQKAYAETITVEANSLLLGKDLVEELHPAVAVRVLQKALGEMAGTAKDLNRIHVQSLRELFELQVGRTLDLPYGMKAKRVYEGVLLTKDIGETVPEKTLAGAIFTEITELTEESQWQSFTGQKRYTKSFDYDIIGNHLELRTRRAGDYLILDESGSSQKLKQYLINEKIPAQVRDFIPLLTQGNKVLWVIGYRMGGFGKVTEQTERVITVTYREEGWEEQHEY